MTASFPLAPFREGILAVAVSVFETLLNLSPRPVAPPGHPPAGPITAALYYAGTWQGALLLDCSSEQAIDWSTRLMSLDPPASMDDARDGLGELANMIAGNLKALLPPGVGLSIPSVVQGADYSLRICGGNLSETLWLQDVSGPFRITLVEVA